METNLASCVFCASPCHIAPPYHGGGEDVKVKIERDEDVAVEDFIIPDPIPPEKVISQSSSSSLVFKEDSAVQEQLKTFFILKNVLKFPNEMLCGILREGGENEGHSRCWRLQLCGSCDVIVSQFYETFKQVSKLQRKMTQMEEELRGKINESKDKADDSKLGGIVRNQVILMDTFGEQDQQSPVVQVSEAIIDQVLPYSASSELVDDPDIDIEYPDPFSASTFKPDSDGCDEEASNVLSEQVNHTSNSSGKAGHPKKRGRSRSIKTTAKKKERKQHGLVKDPTTYVPCPNCNKDLSHIKFQFNRNRHIKDCTTGSIYKCDLCKASFIRLHALQMHVSKRHGQKIIQRKTLF
ncbi:Metallothionein expression activator [Orchesella cincta]|uniref:Metallothionein expression activator n=1 Tax=Orchesella cincta TaxID=48709 RepID=A0A1D2M8X9_ORCCI|nr:Metallothionein expression activator [Orchesella cincta]